MNQKSEETEDIFNEEEIKGRTQCDPSDHNNAYHFPIDSS